MNNFGTTGQIQLILVPIDQKLAELTDSDKSKREKVFRKSKREKFLRLFLANSPIWEGRPFTFYKKNFWKTLTPLPKGNSC